jgi:hypothetical protein
MELKTRILHLLDLEFLAKGTSVIIIGNPGTGKTLSWLRSSPGAPVWPTGACCSPRPWIC